MIKEIKYNGFTAQPSDYECPDGELSTAINLAYEEQTLQPIMQPSEVFSVPEGYTVVFLHKNAGQNYQHYIATSRVPSSTVTTLYWVYYYGSTFNAQQLHSFDGETIIQINAIGNTLLVLASDGMHYIFWKDTQYIDLGTHIPEATMNVGLLGRPRFYSLQYGSTFDISFDEMTAYDITSGKEFSDENKNLITSQVMAKLNKFVADTTVNHGRHCFPFLLRYAIRLYDDTLTMHSAPILMNPCTNTGPIVLWERAEGEGSYTQATLNIMLMAASVLWKPDEHTGLENWKDIVKSVDIFISKPIYTYDQEGEIQSFADTDNFNTKFIGKLYAHHNNDGQVVRVNEPQKSRLLAPITGADKMIGGLADNETTTYPGWFAEYSYALIYEMYFSTKRTIPTTTLHLPERTEQQIKESVFNTGDFYLLHSIPIDDFLSQAQAGTFSEIVTPNEYLPALVSRERMSDDYQTHDKLHPETSFVYNSRLNIAGIKREIFKGYKAENMFAMCDTDYTFVVGAAPAGTEIPTVTVSEMTGSTLPASWPGTINVYTYLKQNGQEHIVKSEGTQSMVEFFTHTYSQTPRNRSSLAWFYYPDLTAYKMVIEQNTPHSANKRYTVTLQPHPLLNGAYALIEYDSERNRSAISQPSTQSPLVYILNKIYSSKIDNPFYFPATGINTIGTGEIRGLSSATMALSQNQSGLFPLYAFTTEGIWAISVNKDGTFGDKLSATRDVCNNPDSITQIDTAVLFTTDRGIMLISGHTSQCISESIDNDFPFSPCGATSDTDALPNLRNILTQEQVSEIQCAPFATFMQAAQMLYDYTHQRILVFNPSKKYAYVYCLRSKKWAMMKSDIHSVINAFPNALAVIPETTETPGETPTTINKVFDVCQDNTSAAPAPQILITRPLKLGAPDLLKTIDTIIQRGHFRKGHVKTILYGSRDLFNWQLIYSSTDHYLRGFRGTPYKYFRIVLLCSLTKDESIFGCTIQFTPRLINQPR